MILTKDNIFSILPLLLKKIEEGKVVKIEIQDSLDDLALEPEKWEKDEIEAVVTDKEKLTTFLKKI